MTIPLFFIAIGLWRYSITPNLATGLILLNGSGAALLLKVTDASKV
jgi:hypothetical protein